MVTAALTVALLTGCISDAQGVRAAPVSSASAAASVSAYRAQNGLGPVSSNAQLNAIAAKQAVAMARQGRLSHSLDGSLQKRLKNGGYVWYVAAENISAGQDTFNEVLAGWSTSAGHRANLLSPDATQIGVGAAHAEDRYGSYWSLIIAAPDAGQGAGPVMAGG